jgi:hypothetical protein
MGETQFKKTKNPDINRRGSLIRFIKLFNYEALLGGPVVTC